MFTSSTPHPCLLALLLCPLSLYAQDNGSQISSGAPSPDFDGNGIVDFSDFFLFADHFGQGLGDEEYDARYDLDGDDVIGFPDFFILADDFGKTMAPTGDDDIVEAAFVRLNDGRKELGLNEFRKAVEGDSTLAQIRLFMGCDEGLDLHGDLKDPDIEAISIVREEGSDCVLDVIAYKVVPTPIDDIVEDAFARLNAGRRELGLNEFRKAVKGDSTLSQIRELTIGCDDGLDLHADLQDPAIQALSIVREDGSDCTLEVVAYRVVITIDIDESTVEAAFVRLNEGRKELGLNEFMKAVKGDNAFVPIFTFVIGCYEELQMHEDLQAPDIHAIGLTPSPDAQECALELVMYHYVPDSEKLRVESSVWECFAESRAIQEANDVSCGGRFSHLGTHVRWLPEEVHYTVVEGESLHEEFKDLIPWIEEKLPVKVYLAESPGSANLFLNLGVEPPRSHCPERWGCSIYQDVRSTIYVSAPELYFDQVLKHELPATPCCPWATCPKATT